MQIDGQLQDFERPGMYGDRPFRCLFIENGDITFLLMKAHELMHARNRFECGSNGSMRPRLLGTGHFDLDKRAQQRPGTADAT
jgi:hypothetical protein